MSESEESQISIDSLKRDFARLQEDNTAENKEQKLANFFTDVLQTDMSWDELYRNLRTTGATNEEILDTLEQSQERYEDQREKTMNARIIWNDLDLATNELPKIEIKNSEHFVADSNTIQFTEETIARVAEVVGLFESKSPYSNDPIWRYEVLIEDQESLGDSDAVIDGNTIKFGSDFFKDQKLFERHPQLQTLAKANAIETSTPEYNQLLQLFRESIIVHEVYHARQKYILSKRISENKDLYKPRKGELIQQFESQYLLSWPERSARAFEIRYLRERLKRTDPDTTESNLLSQLVILKSGFEITNSNMRKMALRLDKIKARHNYPQEK